MASPVTAVPMTVPSTPPRPPASPKFQLPPTTVSPGPGGTRLERVLDLVTSHEATIAENELRVLDLTKRVAEAEDAARARRDEDRRARDAADASLRAELAAVKEAVRRVEGAVASWSDERDALRAEVRDLADGCRADADAALEETKAGFKAVLQDVVDRLATSFDAVRADAVATRGNYASVDEVAALRERVAAAESAARARESHGRETMNAMLDAMEQMKRRTAKLVGFYNEHVEAAERRRAGRRVRRRILRLVFRADAGIARIKPASSLGCSRRTRRCESNWRGRRRRRGGGIIVPSRGRSRRRCDGRVRSIPSTATEPTPS